MCIGKQIDNFWQARINQTRNVIDDYNRLQIEVGKLESVSGFSIESLIKMFAEGYELKKNSRKEAGRVNKEEIVQRLKFVADEIDKDIKIFEETHNFEHIYDYNIYSIKEFIDEFINIVSTMKEEYYDK